MSREMYPVFDIEDFISLPNRDIYLKLKLSHVSPKEQFVFFLFMGFSSIL